MTILILWFTLIYLNFLLPQNEGLPDIALNSKNKRECVPDIAVNIEKQQNLSALEVLYSSLSRTQPAHEVALQVTPAEGVYAKIDEVRQFQ